MRELDIEIFIYEIPIFLKFYNDGFKFHNGYGKILSNEEICDIFCACEEYRQISKCEFINAKFKHETEYYGTSYVTNVCAVTTIYDCSVPDECFIHVLSPNKKHFHDEEGILIVTKYTLIE